jgi:phosphoribosylformylglycinamidine cyclo-ligase
MRLIQTLDIHALAHITGGGFPDNVPRVLPEGLTAVIDRAAWRIPAVFRFIQAQGRIELDEMYRVFNMGIGFILIVAAKDVALAMRILARTGEKAVPIGHIAKGTGRFRWAS